MKFGQRITKALDISEEELSNSLDRLVSKVNPAIAETEDKGKAEYKCHRCGGKYGELCKAPPKPCNATPWFHPDSAPGKLFDFLKTWDVNRPLHRPYFG